MPAELSISNPSAAERRVHRLLKSVQLDGYTALHSLGLSNHDYKIVGEIDFLLVGPDGVFVLEVKGGRIALSEGVWVFTDRFGVDHRKAEGPFDQAKSATFSLIERLRRTIPQRQLTGLVFGWGVVLPDVDFDAVSAEWDPLQVIDRDDTESPARLEQSLEGLVNYWWQRFKGHHRIDVPTGQAIVHNLRPDFEKLPSLRRRIDDIDARALELTDSQYRFIDAVERNQRLVCDGGAGTGKTFLAVETARREAAAGRSVTLTCKSPVLAAFIADQAGLADGDIAVAAISDLAGLSRRADVLIVDEAQDLMNLEDLAVLEASVAGGLSHGRWRFFLDRNHQVGVLGQFDEDAFALVDDGTSTTLHLPDNCRNTVDVVHEVVAITGADVGTSRAAGGPPVLWRWWEEPHQGAELLGGYLTELLEDGVDPDRITILTGADPFSDPLLAALRADLRALVAPLTANTVHRPPRNRIGASRTGLFKGLENSFICVTDVAGLDEQLSHAGVAELYVAMTRPRAGLFMGLPDRLREPITALGRRTRKALQA